MDHAMGAPVQVRLTALKLNVQERARLALVQHVKTVFVLSKRVQAPARPIQQHVRVFAIEIKVDPVPEVRLRVKVTVPHAREIAPMLVVILLAMANVCQQVRVLLLIV
jgi:hypothetical protein